ncbi:Neurobeachin [Liparis tanakae]|uniref:Neurobeachin n=1 Tax=Liparis tanakae TaxID=230148 RepID=A0A4Z2GLJ1_9TELE|nr:Neurobeachin [Liparis tanakae]
MLPMQFHSFDRSVVVPVKKPPPGSLSVNTVGTPTTSGAVTAGSTPNIFAAATTTPKSMINTTGERWSALTVHTHMCCSIMHVVSCFLSFLELYVFYFIPNLASEIKNTLLSMTDTRRCVTTPFESYFSHNKAEKTQREPVLSADAFSVSSRLFLRERSRSIKTIQQVLNILAVDKSVNAPFKQVIQIKKSEKPLRYSIFFDPRAG